MCLTDQAIQTLVNAQSILSQYNAVNSNSLSAHIYSIPIQVLMCFVTKKSASSSIINSRRIRNQDALKDLLLNYTSQFLGVEYEVSAPSIAELNKIGAKTNSQQKAQNILIKKVSTGERVLVYLFPERMRLDYIL